MARLKKGSLPAYRLHKSSGQAVVTIDGKDRYLGPHDTAESRSAYARLITEQARCVTKSDKSVTVNDVAASFWETAQRHPDPRHRERANRVMGYLCRLYGGTLAKDFGPLALKAVRTDMLKANWTRQHTNQCVGLVKRVFKHGVQNELVPEAVYAALLRVEDLRKGQEGVREGKRIVAMPDEDIEPVLAFALPTVADMARLQLLCGARGGEICQMRPMDVDRSGAVWIFTVPRHKTDYLDEVAERFLGPRAQAILASYLLRDAELPCFSPREAVDRERERKKQRKTRGRRAPRGTYNSGSYGHAIARACEAYNATAERAERLAARFGQKVEIRRIVPWTPHQLRHAAATRLVDEFGIEVAQKVLGHRVIQMTAHYSRTAKKRAVEAIEKIG